ncbi:hypothetical protein ACVOMS_11265 [Bradyrhizobium guangxiense]
MDPQSGTAKPPAENALRATRKPHPPTTYYRVRLEHTVRHTQQLTRLIYLINGGALGLLYFVAKLDQATAIGSKAKFIIAGVLTTLAFVNAMHARLIRRQGEWYSAIDAAFADASNAKKVQSPSGRGTHALHADIHVGLAAVLIAGAGLALIVL